jgi:hypothetical protein
MTDDFDMRLRDLLATPSRPADALFAERVRRAAVAEQRFAEARRRAWRRFWAEASATSAAVLAFILLSRFGGSPGAEGMVPLMSPAMLGILLLGLWVGVGLKPSGAVGAAA